MNAKPTQLDASQPAGDARTPRSDGEQSRERLLQAAGANVAAMSRGAGGGRKNKLLQQGKA